MITEKPITEALAPRNADIIRFIGEDRMKKEISFAIQAANQNAMVMEACSKSPQSLAKAIYNVALCDLSLNPVLKLAYLVPKRIDQEWQVVLMPSYQGLVKLITDSGSAQSVYAHCVYAGDDFEPSYGTDVNIKHIPRGKSRKDEDILAVYAVAVLHDGRKQTEIMWAQEINEIRELSDSYRAFKSGKAKSSIWNDWYSEMARKTVIKRLYKYIPKTERSAVVAEAIELDNQEYQATVGQLGFIEALLPTAAITPEEREQIESGLVDLTFHQAQRTIERLKDSQTDPITSGRNYSDTDIQNHQKRILKEQ